MLLRLGHGISGWCRHSAVNASSYLDSALDSVCCDLDATIADSYGGSGQTWSNLIASPADGAAQADYDYYLGADGSAGADDPAFTGTAGDAGAYFALDGGDNFYGAGAIANIPTIRDAHKTTGGSAFWMAVAFYATSLSGFPGIITTSSAAAAHGFTIWFSSSGQLKWTQGSGSQATTTSTATVSTSTENILIISWDENFGNYRIWINSGTASETGVLSKNATTTDATANTLCDRLLVDPMPSGTKLYSVAIGNEYLDDAKAAAIIAHLEARHGRDYTP